MKMCGFNESIPFNRFVGLQVEYLCIYSAGVTIIFDNKNSIAIFNRHILYSENKFDIANDVDLLSIIDKFVINVKLINLNQLIIEFEKTKLNLECPPREFDIYNFQIEDIEYSV
jgi:hypothetical protein